MTGNRSNHRRHIYVEPDVDEQLDDLPLSVSGLCNDLLKAYLAYGDVEQAAEHIARQREQNREHQWKRACHAIAGDERELPRDWGEYNPAALNWASKLKTPPAHVAAVVSKYAATGTIDLSATPDQ